MSEREETVHYIVAELPYEARKLYKTTTKSF